MIKPTLKKVFKYDNKFAKLHEKAAKHPVHFWPKLNGAMRRVLVPNLSATFHALRTKFVHDLKVSASPVIRLR